MHGSTSSSRRRRPRVRRARPRYRPRLEGHRRRAPTRPARRVRTLWRFLTPRTPATACCTCWWAAGAVVSSVPVVDLQRSRCRRVVAAGRPVHARARGAADGPGEPSSAREPCTVGTPATEVPAGPVPSRRGRAGGTAPDDPEVLHRAHGARSREKAGCRRGRSPPWSRSRGRRTPRRRRGPTSRARPPGLGTAMARVCRFRR